MLLFSIMGLVNLIPPVQAAERVVVKYSVFQESLAVSELSNLSRTGEVSPTLQTYLEMANKKPEEVRDILNYAISVNPDQLNQMLNSFVGKYILNKAGEVIQNPISQANNNALRDALVISANTENDIRLIEVLENYPSPEVQINGDRLMELYQQFKSVAGNIPNLPF
ncbi:MAG: alpha/beta hydrolase [Snowella sp.]|nr:alpha/beta hydrolase [Snowella sp.]